MIASLPMYQRPQLVEEHRRYWELIRVGLKAVGVDSPTHLSQEADEFATWRDPTLVLSQTCGMPYRNDLHGLVSLVGTPDFSIEGCPPGFYRSGFVARVDDQRTRLSDFADATFAYNQNHSQSGFAAPFNHTSELGFWFERRFHTGQHLSSAQAVADGQADIAAIDALTWRFIVEHDAFAANLRVIEWTEPTPSLPYISRLDANSAAIFDAVAEAIEQLTPNDRSALGITGFVAIPASEYLQVPNPPAAVIAAL